MKNLTEYEPLFYGTYDREEGKSRFACAHRGCNRGASTGHVITFVSLEPRVGYCDEHYEEVHGEGEWSPK